MSDPSVAQPPVEHQWEREAESRDARARQTWSSDTGTSGTGPRSTTFPPTGGQSVVAVPPGSSRRAELPAQPRHPAVDDGRRGPNTASHARIQVPKPSRFENRTPLLVVAVIAMLAVLAVGVTILRPDKPPQTQAQARGALPGIGLVAPSATAPTEAVKPARLGVFMSSRSEVTRFETWLGQPMQDVTAFAERANWDQVTHPKLTQWQGTKYRLIYGLPMLPDSEIPTKEASMRAGARGEYNAYFKALAERMVAAGQENAVLRVGWEFNLDSWAWGIKDSATFIKFFRQIVTTMRAVPGAKFTIDWNPNNAFNPLDAAKYWPGNAYVDTVGVDVYDLDQSVYGAKYRKLSECNRTCRQLKQMEAWDSVVYGSKRGLGYWRSFAASHHKQLSLPEWGLWELSDNSDGGGDDPLFIERMYNFITAPVNNVAYASYFDHDDVDGTHDLTGKNFPASSKLFKKLFNT